MSTATIPTITWASLLPALPELYLAASVCALLLVDAFLGERRRRLTPVLTVLLLAAGAGLTLAYGQVSERTLLFGGMYVADPLATVIKLFGFLFVALALLYSRSYVDERNILRGEYYVLALASLLGTFVLASAGSLLTLYVGIELLSLALYAMVAFDRDSGVAAESAMKFFVLGAISSGVLLYGISLIYGLTGTLDLDVIATQLAGEPSLGVIVGLAFLVVAVAFKFGAAPFHMWVPDVYHGAPTAVTLFVATTPKLASFAFAYRLLAHGLGPVAPVWTRMLAIIAVLSLVLGNVVAIAQTNVKRLLAYSAIANVGFILLGFVAGTPAGYQAALYYTLVYVLMSAGSFGVILLASRRGFEADELDDFKGLHSRDPLLALCMMVLMLSMAGLPPFIGFWAKLDILQALWAVQERSLVLIAAGVSVAGVYYYLRIVKLMYFDPPGELPAGARGGQGGVRIALAVNGLAVFALGIVPDRLLELCTRLIR
jgi:NADH-quinone oxidoreductase subunit N